jgi:hypothetical protein
MMTRLNGPNDRIPAKSATFPLSVSGERGSSISDDADSLLTAVLDASGQQGVPQGV